MLSLKQKLAANLNFHIIMVKSTLFLIIWPINTPLLLGTYSKSCMAFSLVTLEMTFDLLFKVTYQKSAFVYNICYFTSTYITCVVFIIYVNSPHFNLGILIYFCYKLKMAANLKAHIW
jgi:hypothetical protein